jgi:hypothetical protein
MKTLIQLIVLCFITSCGGNLSDSNISLNDDPTGIWQLSTSGNACEFPATLFLSQQGELFYEDEKNKLTFKRTSISEWEAFKKQNRIRLVINETDKKFRLDNMEGRFVQREIDNDVIKKLRNEGEDCQFKKSLITAEKLIGKWLISNCQCRADKPRYFSKLQINYSEDNDLLAIKVENQNSQIESASLRGFNDFLETCIAAKSASNGFVLKSEIDELGIYWQLLFNQMGSAKKGDKILCVTVQKIYPDKQIYQACFETPW